MKAVAMYPSRKDVRIIDTPEPRLQLSTDVKIRIRDVGICGTDREICAFEYGIPPPGADHLVIGHESVGEVVEVGSQVEHVARGDLVVPMVRRPCQDPACQACRHGRADYCTTGRFSERGINGADGFLSELVVEDERYLVKVPEELADVAVLVEPLTIAAKAGEQLAALQARVPWRIEQPRALVLGAGAVGLLGAMVLRSRGVETYVYSRGSQASDSARLVAAIGAQYISADDLPVDAVHDRLGLTYDLIFEATGNSQLAFDSARNLGPNGICVLTGIPAVRGPRLVDIDRLMRDLVLGNQVIVGTVNAGKDSFAAAVQYLSEFMKKFPDAVRRLIHVRPLDQALAAISESSTGKSVIRFF